MFNLLPYHKWSFKKVILILWLFYFFLSPIIQILVLLYLYSLLLFFSLQFKIPLFSKKKKKILTIFAISLLGFVTCLNWLFNISNICLKHWSRFLIIVMFYDLKFFFLWILSNFWQNVNFPNIIILHFFIQLILIYFFCLITCCLLIYLSFQRKSSA